MQADDPIIPRKVLWADPEKHLAKVSPNGNYIAYLAPHDNNLNLWVAPINDLEKAKPVTNSKDPLRNLWWSKDSNTILYIHDKDGDENWQLHGYQLSRDKLHTYTPPGLTVSIFKFSVKHPQKILIGLNQRDPRFTDVYSLDLATKQLTLVYENNYYMDLIADDDLHVRVAIAINNKGGTYYNLANSKILANLPYHDMTAVHYFPRLRSHISADKQKLYMVQSSQSNTSTLVSVDLQSGKSEALINDKKADICDVLYCPITEEPLAVATNYERKQWLPLDLAIAKDFRYLATIDDGDIDILSQTENNETWLVSFTHDDRPITYYIYHRLKKAVFLFQSHDLPEGAGFTKMHPRVITARDGLACVSYLSLPKYSDPLEKGVPTQPVPLVLMVHGGPHFRDFWGFNPTHQWLANRGYAVLSINYRASTGFGKEHMEKGNGEWAGKIRTDLLDAVNWAIENQITTKDKVAIMGRSFGGYSTLLGLTFTPDTFCCGVDIVGISNLETAIENLPVNWEAIKISMHEFLGCNPDTPEGKAFLKKCSPIYYADKITKPLLIGHGANDIRVKQEESDQMVKAMQTNKIPVTYAIFSDEGHQFMHPGNRMAFYALAELFLAKVLQGRYEAYDANVQTTMQIVVDDFGLFKA